MPDALNLGKILFPPIQVVRNGETWVIGNLNPQQIASCIDTGRVLGQPVMIAVRYENASMFASEFVVQPRKKPNAR